jgi:hypothetical protein
MSFLSTGLVVLLAAVILFLLMTTGLILFIVGFFGIFRKKYAGTKKPAVRMIAGLLMITLPVIGGGFLGIRGMSDSLKDFFTPTKYVSVPARWQNERVTASQAEDQIIRALLRAADEGKKNSLSIQFSDETQRTAGFQDKVDAFFEAYPTGLGQCEPKNKIRESADGYGSNAGSDAVSFGSDLNGERYFVYIKYCYRHADHPEKVGVTEFRVMNLEAAAVFFGVESGEPDCLICDIRSAAEYNARLIGGQAYLWDSDDPPRVSEQLLRRILDKTTRLDDPIYVLTIGEPGVIIKHPDSTQFGYFYQLSDEDGEERYAYFQTDSERGRILWVLLCTPYEVDDKHPLVNRAGDGD